MMDHILWYPNHLGFTYLLPITKIHSMFVSICIKLNRIWINSCSLFTKTYGLKPLRTWTNSHSYYTKTHCIELCQVLPVLYCITFVPSPDIWVIFGKHLLRVIIFAIPVIDQDVHFPCLWYHSYFACPVLLLLLCCYPYTNVVCIVGWWCSTPCTEAKETQDSVPI